MKQKRLKSANHINNHSVVLLGLPTASAHGLSKEKIKYCFWTINVGVKGNTKHCQRMIQKQNNDTSRKVGFFLLMKKLTFIEKK